MKLFEFGPTRSIRARWTLQELGIDFEAVTVNLLAGEHRRPDFLRFNPAGKVPALVDDDLVLTESVAIALYRSGTASATQSMAAIYGDRTRATIVAHHASHEHIPGGQATARRRCARPRGVHGDGERDRCAFAG